MLLGSAAIGWLRIGDAPEIAGQSPPPPPPPPPGPPIIDQVGPPPVIFWGQMLLYSSPVKIVITGALPVIPSDDI
jgi:hypothetical protein